MGLKQEFNRQDDSAGPIERIDAGLTRAADRWAKRWQAATPFSRQSLTMGCYVIASLLSLGYVLLSHQILFFGVALLAYMGSAPGKQRGSLVEELQLEVTGLPKHTLKYLAVFLLGLGLFGIASSVLPAILGAFGSNVALSDLLGIVGGGSLVLLKTADYIARTNPNNRDGDRERQIERVRSRQALPTAC